MFKKRLEFIIKAAGYVNTLNEVLTMVAAIKKAHPDAEIHVEMEV